jgi:hypothetical protein
MGFFKSLKETADLGKEMQKDFDPAAQMTDGIARMQDAQAIMAAQTDAANLSMTGVDARATIASVAQTGAMVNFQPTLAITLTVFREGAAPYPATVTTVVPQHQLAMAAPGASVAVKVDPSAPDKIWINWAAPVPQA